MFERYVADKRRKRPLLYIAFVGSTILEAALIIFFIIYSILHVEEVQPPLLTVNFINAAPPPPPPPAPPKGSNKPKPKVPKPVVQPQDVPKDIVQPKDKEEPEEDKGSDEGVEGGVEGGVPGGVAGGVPGGAPAPPPPAPVKPKIVPAFKIEGEKLSGEMPHLPDVIKAQRRGSTVMGTYKICIESSGQVSSVTPISSIPGGDASVIGAVQGWRFKPQPVPVCFIRVFQFIIE